MKNYHTVLLLLLLGVALGASATAHLRLEQQSSKQSVTAATAVCSDDQRDHSDGNCGTHKKNGGCSPGNSQRAAWQMRCPVSCGVCKIPVCAFGVRDHYDGNCGTHKENGACSAGNSQRAAWQMRCPVSCGVCVYAANVKEVSRGTAATIAYTGGGKCNDGITGDGACTCNKG